MGSLSPWPSTRLCAKELRQYAVAFAILGEGYSLNVVGSPQDGPWLEVKSVVILDLVLAVDWAKDKNAIA